MAKVTVVKSGNSVRINFNDYGSLANINSKYRSFDVRDIVEIEMPYDESHIHVVMRDAHEIRQWDITWDSTYAGSDYFIIDSVDAAPPTSQADLFDKLEALR